MPPSPANVDGARFRRFCQGFVRQTKGRWAGRPLVVEPWQAGIVDEILFRDPKTGLRRYSEALIGIPRKNGKSTLSAALALYFLVVEGTLNDPGAEIYAAAGSKDQARIVFEQTKAFVLSSPKLAALCDVQKDRIVVKETGAVFRVLSSDAPRQHGLNPSLVIIDELHAHKNGDLYEALTTGDLAREEPLTVTITTAGDDVEGSILGEVFTKLYGTKPRVDRKTGLFIRHKQAPADMFGRWWTVDDKDLDDPEAWKRANPASWVTAERLAKKAPPRTKRGSWERLHLNRWTRAEEAWLPVGAWESCEGGPMLEEGDKVYAGLDMGRKHDTAAVVIVGPQKLDTANGIFRRPVEAYVWGVQPDPSKPPPAATEIVDGDRVPFDLVEDHLRNLGRTYDLEEVAYDPWRFDRSAETLEGEGLTMVEYPQTNERMCPASQGLYDAVVSLAVAHDGDDVLAAHVDAAVSRDVGRDTWRLDKRRSKTAMDASVALAIAYDRAVADEGGGFTVRGMNERGDATPDPAGAPELHPLVSDLVYRGIAIDWRSLGSAEAASLVVALRKAVDVFYERDEVDHVDACQAALAARRAAA
jgi:phage terminase large subunit-like protein